jgi:hypothetical protein
MKRRGPTLGHCEANYQLWNIFKRYAEEFARADAAKIKADKEYKKNPKAPIFPTLEKRTEAGVILLVTTAALLERIINDYAYTFLDPASYEEHLGNLRTITKWLLLPRLCQNKEIAEDNPTITDFRELIKARNVIVHHRRKELDLTGSNKVKAEIQRFLSACRKAESTVGGLIKILEAPSSGKF